MAIMPSNFSHRTKSSSSPLIGISNTELKTFTRKVPPMDSNTQVCGARLEGRQAICHSIHQDLLIESSRRIKARLTFFWAKKEADQVRWY